MVNSGITCACGRPLKEELIPKAPYNFRPQKKHPDEKHLQWWRDRVWTKAYGYCQCCKVFLEQERMEVHHVTYERFGHELPEDGVLLCQKCHDSITRETRRRRRMAWKYFKAAEFACRCCGQNHMSDTFIDKLDALREAVGFPLVVTSGYRCPEHNNRVSSTGRNGPHTTGRAVDLAVDRQRAYELVRVALQMGFTGIGVQQKGLHRFIHLDDLQDGVRPTIWSY